MGTLTRSGELLGWARTVFAIGVVACSSGATSSTGDIPPGPPPGDSAMADGGSSQPDTDSCAVATLPEVVLADAKASSLRVVGDELVFVAGAGAAAGVADPRTIRRIRADGTGSALVYTAPEGTRISNLVADEAAIYFLQTEQVRGSERALLYTVPVGGGMAARLDAASAGYDHDAELISIDESSVYVAHSGLIARVGRSDGLPTVIAKPTSSPTDVQRVGNLIYYALAHGQFGIFKVPADALAVADTRIGDVRCGPYAVSITASAIFCGLPGGVVRFDEDGTHETTVVDGIALGDASLAPSLPDGDNIYLYSQSGLTSSAALRRMSTTGGPAVPVACDRGNITEIRFGAAHVFWIETRDVGGSRVSSIYRLAK